MKYKEYSEEFWTRIHATLDEVLKSDPHPVAAFDADGTLWDIDLGETFFHHQIDNKLLPLPPEPWEYYEKLKAVNAPEAYLWLAQICNGKSLNLIHEWAKEGVLNQSPLPIFLEQKN